MIVKVYPHNVYTFRFESNFTSTDIDFVDVDNSDANCYPYIYNFPGPRPYVLGLSDNNNAGKCSFDHIGFDITTTGAIEFLFKDFTTAGNFILTLYDGATRLVIFQYDRATTKFQYDIGGGFQDIYDDTRNPWRIITITIDIDAGVNGQFSCYYKDNEYSTLGSVTGIEFENNATTVDTLRFETEDAPLQAIVPHYFIDCIGITAEGSYTLGDIQYAEVDVATYMENTRIHGGIIPYKKLFTFICHPNYEAYFNEGFYIDVYDVNEVLCFMGYIKTKSRDNNGIYNLSCQGMANEVFERTYDKSFSSDKTSEKLQDIIDNKLEFCYRDTSITATATDYSYEYNRTCIYMFNLTRYLERQVVYIEPDGKVWSKDYDALTATGKSWTLYDGNQNALLIDIPGLQDSIPGYYFGNTGITSVSVRYKDNTTTIRPATPVETFKKKRLKEFRDSKIQASTEANQLGDNLYDIFALDTIFLGMKIDGQGWLQPGKTIQIENTGQITITQAHFLIVKFVYDPKNDVYLNMILSSNIITPKEFKSDLDTSQQQIHTATLQSFENQETLNIQHNRPIYPTLVIAQDAHTVGVNNVYRLTSFMNHGTNSKTTGHGSFWHFTLPDDYIDGENLTVVLHYIIGGGSEVISYQWLHQYYLDGAAVANANTPSGSYTSNATANYLNIETSTVTGTNLVAGCHMLIVLRCEHEGALAVRVIGIHLIVPVNTRV